MPVLRGLLGGAKKLGGAIRRNPIKAGVGAGVGGLVAAEAPEEIWGGGIPEEVWEQFEMQGHLQDRGDQEQELLQALREEDPERFTAILFKHGHKLGSSIPGGGM